MHLLSCFFLFVHSSPYSIDGTVYKIIDFSFFSWSPLMIPLAPFKIVQKLAQPFATQGAHSCTRCYIIFSRFFIDHWRHRHRSSTMTNTISLRLNHWGVLYCLTAGSGWCRKRYCAGSVADTLKLTIFSTSGFFHESDSSKPLSIPLASFQIFLKLRNSRCTTGVIDTGGKWKISSIIKVFIILFGHLWKVELVNFKIHFCLQVHFKVLAAWYCSHYLPLTQVANLPPVSATKLVAKFAAGVVDTGGAHWLVNTSANFPKNLKRS